MLSICKFRLGKWWRSARSLIFIEISLVAQLSQLFFLTMVLVQERLAEARVAKHDETMREV